MQLVRGLSHLKADARGAAVAIGNFDGVHLGHQALVRAVRERAAASGARPVVLTFDPHPREFFDPAGAPPRLMRVVEKCMALAALGVERLVIVRFDARLQQQSAEEFIRRMLVESLGARHVVVGEGFRFGCRRDGTVATLRDAGAVYGFEVVTIPSVELDGARVSSTRVREALATGDLATAGRLLGRRFVLGGRVITGARLGRQLGFATANMRLHRPKLPLSGVFAVQVHGADGRELRDGVASLGTRPTVHGVEPLLEAHLFDYTGDLYGRRLSVEFVAKLRDEERFPSLAALTEQMHRDAARAREILAARAA
ncbi:MAG TPA: bifunctional riboflavin kinase/FAD synthetase [Steroidobacteraceae bacterium]|nr:bifunctional riboflavin kinase/FAD synthetase [Steroidobacteraceae bacterium]